MKLPRPEYNGPFQAHNCLTSSAGKISFSSPYCWYIITTVDSIRSNKLKKNSFPKFGISTNIILQLYIIFDGKENPAGQPISTRSIHVFTHMITRIPAFITTLWGPWAYTDRAGGDVYNGLPIPHVLWALWRQRKSRS